MRRAWLVLGLVASAGACDPRSGPGAASMEDAAIRDGGDAPDGRAPDGPLRSALYPEDWSPNLTLEGGLFLHDFSYAGYHGGERTPRPPAGARVVDVEADFGADPTGVLDATAAFAAAIAAVSMTGGVVRVPAGLYRIDGILEVRASGVVIQGEGPERSRVFFTSSAGMSYRAHLAFRGALVERDERALVRDAARRNAEVEVTGDATGWVGSDVTVGWVITPAFVAAHRMTGIWTEWADEWAPFFRRTVVDARRTAAGDTTLVLSAPLRYDALVRDAASVRVVEGALHEIGIESVGLGNAVAWHDAWAEQQVHVLALDGVVDGWVRDVSSFDPPTGPTSGPGAEDHLQSGGLLIASSARVTVERVTLVEAENRGSGGNGYLFEVRASSEVLHRDCEGRAGRHNFIQNWGFGTTGVVWQRVRSAEGRFVPGPDGGLETAARSELHHSLAMACLVDDSILDDGWNAIQRGAESSGAGLTGTETVLWRARGGGQVASYQFGHGYVIGTGPELGVTVESLELDDPALPWFGAAPDDFVEHLGLADRLEPRSLYDDQLARRLGR